ncbi:sigma-70 family RNA polymerase sigma factor [Myxococcota bacterium]|nr:sigma-70 family RNA polymerase sigma factor [Myxococcota bacterium]
MDYTDFTEEPPLETPEEIFDEPDEDIELVEEEETAPTASKAKPGILTKEREEEIAVDMERGKRQAIDAALRCKCMEKSLDNLLDWVMRENGRVWRYLEDPREDGVGETSMLDAITGLSKIRNRLGKYGDRLSKSFLEIHQTKDVTAVKNIRRRVRRAFKHRQEIFYEDLGYSIRIEFFDDLSQRFKDGISVLFKGIDEKDFVQEYGASAEEFREISQEFFGGERLFQKSREELILANQRLVIYFARKYQEQGVDLVDLIGEGNIGLLRAVERFDPGKGSRLATYATWWIKHNLNRAVANQGSTIRVPGHVREEKNRILKVITEMTITESKSPTFYDVAQRLDIPIERVHHILRRTQGTISIDKPLGTDAEDETLQKLLPDSDVLTPEEEVSKAFDKIWVKELLLELTPRERLIIEMRYGLTGKDAMTLQEVGAHLDITRERVRQLQTKAESKLFKLARKLGYFSR